MMPCIAFRLKWKQAMFILIGKFYQTKHLNQSISISFCFDLLLFQDLSYFLCYIVVKAKYQAVKYEKFIYCYFYSIFIKNQQIRFVFHYSCLNDFIYRTWKSLEVLQLKNYYLILISTKVKIKYTWLTFKVAWVGLIDWRLASVLRGFKKPTIASNLPILL